jgi:protein kinase-like protein
MTTCPVCSREVVVSAGACPACGAPIPDDTTRLSPEGYVLRAGSPGTPATTPRRASDARFVTGTVLAGRYRIVTLLGRGGMGEVYQADDLKLDHPVALKFLPDTLALDSQALSRFHAEVRIARQVSHPNVCRVYDIGDVDGLQFLTMEFIDGEDLASLLRRIKRLPPDKAVEVARQLCAGLAAAHDAGVIHRDLKPANVMIDKRGRTRITDFGVAAIARDVRGGDVLAGTPSYMAPEQLRGQDASIRSDVYSLGLVLYEIFTGRRAIDAKTLADAVLHHSSASPITTPSSWVPDLDPVVERAILRCLERDPDARPASAIHVSAALPGGDPLQAALAAGETPSPEMVAAAGTTEALRPAVGLALLIASVIAMVAGAWASNQRSIHARLRDGLSAEVLVHRAREIFAELGYSDPPADSAYGFEYDMGYLTYDRLQFPAADRMSRLLIGRPPVVQFWYRESPEPLVAQFTASQFGPPRVGPVTADNPPLALPRMRLIALDAKGRLIEFRAVPPELDREGPAPTPMNWDRVFALAGLDRSAFEPAEPTRAPTVAFDERRTWKGVYPEQPRLPLRLDVAAYRGRLVTLQGVGPWNADGSDRIVPRRQAVGPFVGVIIYGILLAAVVMAWLSVRAGRGDRRGAVRLAMLALVLAGTAWALDVDHTASAAELLLFRQGIGNALIQAASTYVIYLALEPYVRRRWPQALIAWSRALTGRLRDPLVGRETLVGAVIASALLLCGAVVFWLSGRISDVAPLIDAGMTVRRTTAVLLGSAEASIFLSVSMCFLVFVLWVVLRLRILADAVVVLLFAGVGASDASLVGIAIGALTGLCAVVALRGFGLVALTTFIFLNAIFPLLRTAMAWSGGSGVFMLGALITLTAYACYIAIGSPRLLPKV